MARTKTKERARARILDDQEISDVWRALDRARDRLPKCFPALIRVLLLTGQRRGEVVGATWQEIKLSDKTWDIPAERRSKGGPTTVPLTEPVLALLGAPRKRGYIFTVNGSDIAFSGFSDAQRKLHKAIAELRKEEGRNPMPQWQLHDLRRTAHAAVKVPSDLAERVVGHAKQGVRGTYDRHHYLDEKRDALEKLAAEVGRIIDPPPSNVVQLEASRR